jgi:hypothetical protein
LEKEHSSGKKEWTAKLDENICFVPVNAVMWTRVTLRIAKFAFAKEFKT